MKRKFYSLEDMARAKWEASVVFSRGKRNKTKVQPSHFNASDTFYTTSKQEELVEFKKQKKGATKRNYSDKECLHFKGRVIN